MEEVMKFCTNHNLFLVEDAAQALGSFFKGKHLGTFGHIGSFSFSAPKIITTGQGGALVTNDGDLYQQAKRIKNFGRDREGGDIHDEWGWNFRFTDIQAVIGIEQMKKLPWRIQRQKEIYKHYSEALKHTKEIEFIPTNLQNTTPWFIDIFVEDPNDLAAFLQQRGVGSRRIYPAVHTQKIYQRAYQGKVFPVAEKYAARGLWLPSSSKLSNEEIDFVTKTIKDYYHHQ